MNIFDLHCDTIEVLAEKNKDFSYDGTQLRLDDRILFNKMVQCMAIFIPDNIRGQNAENFVIKYNIFLNNLVKKYKKAEFAIDISDIENISKRNNAVLIKTLEGGSALNGKLENIKKYYDMNFKMMTLTWNGENEIGSGWDNPNIGLKNFGKKVITEMEHQNMIIDCSHLNDKGFNDLLEISKKAFVASHSNLRSICNHKRNLNDEQFIEIVKRNGLCGINLFNRFITNNDVSASI